MYFFSRRQVKGLYIKKKINMTEEVKKERLLRYRDKESNMQSNITSELMEEK